MMRKGARFYLCFVLTAVGALASTHPVREEGNSEHCSAGSSEKSCGQSLLQKSAQQTVSLNLQLSESDAEANDLEAEVEARGKWAPYNGLSWEIAPSTIEPGQEFTVKLQRPKSLCCSYWDWVGIYERKKGAACSWGSGRESYVHSKDDKHNEVSIKFTNTSSLKPDRQYWIGFCTGKDNWKAHCEENPEEHLLTVVKKGSSSGPRPRTTPAPQPRPTPRPQPNPTPPPQPSPTPAPPTGGGESDCVEKRSVPKCGMCKNTDQCSCGFCCPSMQKCRCNNGCGAPPAGWTELKDTCDTPPPPTPVPSADEGLPYGLPAGSEAHVGECVAKIPGWTCQGHQCQSNEMWKYTAGGAPGDCPSSNPYCMPWCLPADHSLCTSPDKSGDGSRCNCPTSNAHGCGRCPLTAEEVGTSGGGGDSADGGSDAGGASGSGSDSGGGGSGNGGDNLKIYEMPNAQGKLCKPNVWTGQKVATPEKCWEIILARSDCSHTFFNHATDGDNNCGYVPVGTACEDDSNWESSSPTRIYTTEAEWDVPSVEPDTPAPAATGTSSEQDGSTGSAMSQGQVDAVVKKHNDLRAGMGASDMMTLKWNAELANRAQEWSSTCPGSKHSENRGYDGENMAQSAGSNFQLTSETDLTGSVQSWYDEISDAGPYKNGGTFSGFDACTGTPCGHYTQVVWQAANEIGCGVTSCPLSGMPGYQLTCQYRSTLPGKYGGNMGGSVVFTKGTACASCPSGFKQCSSGLCSD